MGHGFAIEPLFDLFDHCCMLCKNTRTHGCAQVAFALISIALFATFRAYKIGEKKKRKASGGIQTTISHPGATSSRARLAQFVASFQR